MSQRPLRNVRRLSLVLVASSLAFASLARADDPTPSAADVRKADELFNLGLKLAKEDKLAEACAAYERSMQLAPGVGVAINLADCHELQGRTATALVEWQEALRLAEKKKKADKIKKVRERIAGLQERISTIELRLAAGVSLDSGTQITIDEQPIERDWVGRPHAFDPGVHLVEARAEGRTPWKQKVTLAPEADRQVVIVPELAPIAPVQSKAAPEGAPLPKANPTTVVSTAARTEGRSPSDANGQGKRPSLVPGIVVGSLGVISLGFAGAMAITAQSSKDAAGAASDGSVDRSSARTQQLLGQIGLGVGIAATGVGAYLLVHALVASPASATVDAHADGRADRWGAVAPWVGPGTAGVSLTGRF